jgi:hypothetical protein
MQRALRLKGNYVSSFMVVPGKGIVALDVESSFDSTKIGWGLLKGRVIRNRNVILEKYGDIPPFANGPIFKCETLIMDGCDENFVAYWLNKKTFPNVKCIYMGSPWDGHALLTCQEVYFHEYYKNYKERLRHGSNIKLISDSEYKQFLANYQNDNLIIE